MENLGIHINRDLNRSTGAKAGIISQAYSPITILVIPTNEELQIAIDTAELIS
ncbi:MAG TPA: hypothetical protein P5533_03310 [Candidatus Cloacimonadota bacterium]|nr:hypothetical protein [Candidatus Cloacimonadota bacterium]